MHLTLTERLRLNHPNAVLRKWQAFMKPEERPEPGTEPKPTLKDSVAELEAAREASGEPVCLHDSGDADQCAEIIERLTAFVQEFSPQPKRKAVAKSASHSLRLGSTKTSPTRDADIDLPDDIAAKIDAVLRG